MTDEKYQKIQGLKDELFQSKTEEAFNEVLSKLGEAVNADPTLSDTYKEKLRGYVKNLRTKKQEYWKKFSNKPAYAKKEVYLLRPETEEKLQAVLDLIAKRLAVPEPETETTDNVKEANDWVLDLDDRIIDHVGKKVYYKGYIIRAVITDEDGFLDPDYAGGWDIYQEDGKFIKFIDSFKKLKEFFGEPYEVEKGPITHLTQEELDTIPNEDLTF